MPHYYFETQTRHATGSEADALIAALVDRTGKVFRHLGHVIESR